MGLPLSQATLSNNTVIFQPLVLLNPPKAIEYWDVVLLLSMNHSITCFLWLWLSLISCSSEILTWQYTWYNWIDILWKTIQTSSVQIFTHFVHLYHSLFGNTLLFLQCGFFRGCIFNEQHSNLQISYTTIAIHNYSSNLHYSKILSQCATHQVNMCSLDHISPR
jgi:hypothetical protein